MLTPFDTGANVRHMLTSERITGMDLRLERTRRRVKVTELARAMGVGHPRISQIESCAVVTDDAARRYLDALATFHTVETSQPAAEAV